MNEILRTLTGTSGVRGVAVFDGSGACIASELPPPYEPNFIAAAMNKLASAFDFFRSFDDSAVDGFCLNCDAGSLVMRQSAGHTVVALTEPEANMNMLSVALNVVSLNLSRHSSLQNVEPDRATLDSHVSYGSQMLSPSGSHPGVAVPADAVDRAVLQQFLRVYKEYMGPAAKMVLKQQLAELGVTSRTLRKSQVGDFIVRLARRIPVAERQQEFMREAEQLRTRLIP